MTSPKDTTFGDLLSGTPNGYNPAIRDRKIVSALHPNNPLRGLIAEHQRALCSLLLVYAGMSEEPIRDRLSEEVEAAEDIVNDARKLADRITTKVFDSPMFKGCGLAPGFAYLPHMLGLFAKDFGQLLAAIGKPGHKHKMVPNRILIASSELVRRSTGKYNDEHLAELFQQVAPLHGELSAEAIRKKRNYIRRHYPQQYESGCQLAAKMIHKRKPEES